MVTNLDDVSGSVADLHPIGAGQHGAQPGTRIVVEHRLRRLSADRQVDVTLRLLRGAMMKQG